MDKRLLIIGSILLLLAGCSDGRPDFSEAKKQFEQLYPRVQVVSMRISEDEVVARSFRFSYRKPGDKSEKEIEIQFMENPNTKRWSPNPVPPRELP
jgi:hypothetical protein